MGHLFDDSVDIAVYNEFWNNYDFNSLPPTVLIDIAKSVISIVKQRRDIYDRYPQLEENSILFDTFTDVASVLLDLIDRLKSKMMKIMTEAVADDVTKYLTELHKSTIDYLRLLNNTKARKDTEDIEFAVSDQTRLTMRTKEYESIVSDSTECCKTMLSALLNDFEIIRQDLAEARYKPIEIGLDFDFSMLSLDSSRSDGGSSSSNSSSGSSSSSASASSYSVTVPPSEISYFPLLTIGTEIEYSNSSDVTPKLGTVTAFNTDGSIQVTQSGGGAKEVIGKSSKAALSIKLSRWSGEFLGDKTGNKHGMKEQELLVAHLGMNLTPGKSGFMKNINAVDYDKIFSTFDYCSLPWDMLPSVVATLQECLKLRMEDMNRYKNPDHSHKAVWDLMNEGLNAAKAALREATTVGDAAKKNALKEKREKTLAARKKMNGTSTSFKNLNNLLQALINEKPSAVQSRSSANFLDSKPPEINSTGGGSRARSSYDYFRSNVWVAGSGSRQEMISAYHNWKNEYSSSNFSSQGSSSGNSGGKGSSTGSNGGSSGGGYSFDTSNIVIY